MIIRGITAENVVICNVNRRKNRLRTNTQDLSGKYAVRITKRILFCNFFKRKMNFAILADSKYRLLMMK
ncbi:hypothetical protein DYH52_11620 [Morganella morganii]|uniref:Uncharacterized protein n=1 Tax=Morganella morganii TaxID=582 RepID=A0A8I0PV58_MORMO|nr:hypothetical protein CO693_10580 [Morganella morganii]AUR31067.1 hypothetical protein C1O70_05985 [Morganella morganii]AUU00793.1 hypothetical protein MC49_011785 [Morganella morganii]AVD60639.1 hypothetical protein C4E49_15190 [Morganella morganii]KGP45461.1 hypothetical protein LR61_05490 [Morganella morganii]